MSVEAEFYRANVDPEVDRRMLHHAHLAVRVAQIESRDYPDMELDAVPAFRRLNYNQSLLFGTYPAGSAVVRKAHVGGSHAVVIAGAVAITSLTRSHMPGQIDLQPYQETLATDPQVDLFPPEEAPAVVTKLWGLLIYGAPYRSTKLTICRMTFPTPEAARHLQSILDCYLFLPLSYRHYQPTFHLEIF